MLSNLPSPPGTEKTAVMKGWTWPFIRPGKPILSFSVALTHLTMSLRAAATLELGTS